MRKFFHSYLGALYIRNGLPTIQDWITRLIEPDVAPTQGFSPPPSSNNYSPSPYVQQNFGQHQPGGYFHPAPPPGVPPPLPPLPATPSSSMSLVTLALVNQTAAQKGIAVTYTADQTGPPHQPTWTVRCLSKSSTCSYVSK